MHISKTQSGHAVLMTLTVILTLVVLGIVGFVLWNNFLKPKTETAEDKVVTTVKLCADGENETATNGIFCSEDIGVKFTVPAIFKDKVKAADSYEVYEGPLDPETKTAAGKSEYAFKAEIIDTDSLVLTIALEPLRTGYVGVGHHLQNAYFNQQTGILSKVNYPARQYDSESDTFTETGSLEVGEAVPSFTANGVRIFKGENGDAGVSSVNYLAVIKEKILKVELTYSRIPGDTNEPTIEDPASIFDELDADIKGLLVASQE